MTEQTPTPDASSRQQRRSRLRWSALVVAVVGALVVAFTQTGGAPDATSPTFSAEPGPGRAVQGGGTDVDAVAATTADASSEADAAVDTDPNLMHLQKAGSSRVDVRSLHGKVEKHERPEHEMQFGGEDGEGAENGDADAAEQDAVEQDAAEEEPASSAASAQPSAPAPDDSFDGLDFATWGAGHPPDTNGDVGPTVYIQTINTAVGIYDKATHNQLAAFTFDTLMSQGSFGNQCDTENFGDPVVLYDSFEDRWVITDFAFQLDGGGNVNPQHVFECFAVSKTGDPVAGGWNFYSLETPGGLGDYPKLGVWDDGIYMSANMFGYAAGAAFQGTHVWALDKAQMYAGAPSPRVVDFVGPVDDFTLIPANARLQAGTPPAGTPEYFVSTWNFTNAVGVYKLDVDWTRPAAATFTGPDLPVAGSSWPNANTPQASTPGNPLDTLGIRAMAQAQYSDIGGAESLWVTHTVRRADISGFAAPRWYQLDVSGGTVAANAVQAATFDPDAANTVHRYIPSLAVDRLGDLALDYTVSNSTTDPEIAYAGRLAGDPVNAFSQGEQLLIAGTGTQLGSCGGTCTRWGDYSGMALDPDGCRFWMTGEYYQADGLNHHTRIGSFAYPGCTAVGNGTLSGTVTAGGSPAAGATVQLGARTTTTNASGAYTFSVPSGVYPSLTASHGGFSTGSATGISVPSGGTATRDFALTASANTSCFTDNSQSAFQTGDPNGCELDSSPGSIKLAGNVGVDQSNLTVSLTGSGLTTTVWNGQTFVPTKSGNLTQVDLDLFCSGCTGTTPNLTVSIRATTGSPATPTGADLATATISGFSSGSGSFRTATFASPLAVTSGTAYAVIVRPSANPSAGTYAWLHSAANPFAGGSRVNSGDAGANWTADTTRDYGFKVTIDAGFPASGTFTSSTKDANPAAGSTADWTTLAFTATTPASTSVGLQIAASNSSSGPFNYVGPDGTAATFFTTGVGLGTQFDGERYLRYRLTLSTSDSTATPSVSAVTLCFADVATTGLAVAPAAGAAGGTTTLSATLSTAGSPVAGKSIAFSLNGTGVGSAVTNAAGVATLAGASLAGIAAGTYPHGVSASFAGDVTDLTSNATNVLTVSGVTPPPGAGALSVKPSKGKFGSVAVSGGSKTKKFKVTNTGTAALRLSKIKLKGAKGNYRLKGKACAGSSIAAGATCTVKVVFDPVRAGAHGAKLTFIADVGKVTVLLTGTGTG